ncbi:hypothetical protein Tco_1151207, partial [Tanacetum coccineum]
MSANDDFSLHDDEELSLHDDASLAGSVPASNKGDAPAKPQQIITTNTLSNIKLPVLQKDEHKNNILNLLLLLLFDWVIRDGETMIDSVFKLDLCKLVIAKMCSTITDDGTRGTEFGKERFKKFANYSSVIGGERLCFNLFRQ